jgi:hypothetical protein
VNPNFIVCALNKTGMVFLYWLRDVCLLTFLIMSGNQIVQKIEATF